MRRRENLTAVLYLQWQTLFSVLHNPNGDTYSFMEKTRVTSYEITKLSFTCVLKFHGLRSFQTGPLHRYASSRRCSAPSLRSDTKLLFRSETLTLPSIWNSKLAQPFLPECFALVLRSAEGLVKEMLVQGLWPRAIGRGLPAHSNP